MSQPNSPFLYETLFGNFTDTLGLHEVNEQNQIVLSVLDNMQRILSTRVGSLKHLPDYGLSDMTKILRGCPVPASTDDHAHESVAEIRTAQEVH